LASTKYWRRQNISVDGNYWHRQNSRVNKNLAPTKISRRQKSRTDKNLVSTKCCRRCRRIPLMFGLAESTAADFSQTSQKISFVSQMDLISLHAVTKCGIFSGCPAFMSGLSPALYQLIVPARHAENIKNFGTDKTLASA
jgi:hypothetical protein